MIPQKPEFTNHRDVTDGTSKTYLIAEKYLNPRDYENGRDQSDNETWCTGFNNDNFRVAFWTPMRDRYGLTNWYAMGSAHPGGFNASYCDGSVRLIDYTIDGLVHIRSATRADD